MQQIKLQQVDNSEILPEKLQKKKKLKLFVMAVTLIFVSFSSLFAFSKVERAYKVGDEIDNLDGVAVYYNGVIGHVKERNLAPDGYNIGLKWQCVEFVKRYYYEYYDHKFPNSYGHAKDFFKASIKDGGWNQERALVQYKNGSQSQLKKGDLVVFDGTKFNIYGHVAIVSAVWDDRIEIIQQNPGPIGSSRVIYPLKHVNGKWYIEHKNLLGWLRKKAV